MNAFRPAAKGAECGGFTMATAAARARACLKRSPRRPRALLRGDPTNIRTVFREISPFLIMSEPPSQADLRRQDLVLLFVRRASNGAYFLFVRKRLEGRRGLPAAVRQSNLTARDRRRYGTRRNAG